MTLHRQLIIVISAVFIAMFLGTWLSNIQSTRAFLEEQLASHAQDTATSLGLSLTPHMANNDEATMTAMVDAIFDRGYYLHITVARMDGTLLIDRRASNHVDGVPSWFVDRIPLNTPERTSVVMSGWDHVATVKVRSHPGLAYTELWSSTTLMLSWFAALTVLSIAFTTLALRLLLKPLRAVERQAEDICNRQYTLQQRLPRTRELRSVVEAMNRMTRKVQEMFDTQASTTQHLREQAFIDTVTGLGNRRYFDAQALEQLKSDRVSQGALILIRLHGLQQLNENSGFAAGDRLLRAAATILGEQPSLPDKCVTARLSGGDFALLAAHMDSAQAEEWAQTLADRLAQLYADNLTSSAEVLHLGATIYQHGDRLSDLLSQADTALRTAQSTGANTWALFQRDTGTQSDELGRQVWSARIKEAIQQRNIVLYAQQAVSVKNPENQLHREVLIRLNATDGGLHSANKFMPIAAQLGLAPEIDYLVVEKLVSHLDKHATTTPIAINLSSATLRNPAFGQKILQAIKHCKSRLIFEISEYTAVRELENLRLFATQAQAHGHAVAIDHFGRAFSSFGYLQSLRPYYVKIDGTFTHDIEHDRDRQFYIRSLCSVAHSLDIPIIAANIEHHTTLAILASLDVDGAQGYAIGEILPI